MQSWFVLTVYTTAYLIQPIGHFYCVVTVAYAMNLVMCCK